MKKRQKIIIILNFLAILLPFIFSIYFINNELNKDYGYDVVGGLRNIFMPLSYFVILSILNINIIIYLILFIIRTILNIKYLALASNIIMGLIFMFSIIAAMMLENPFIVLPYGIIYIIDLIFLLFLYKLKKEKYIVNNKKIIKKDD